MRRRTVIISTSVVALLLGLSFAPLWPQSTYLPLVELLNRGFNPATNEFQTSTWAWAQGTNLSIVDIFNRAFRAEGNYFAFSGLSGGGEVGPNTVGSAEVVDNSLTGDDVNESTLVMTGLIGGPEVNESTLVFTDLIGSTDVINNSLTGTDIDESTLVLTGLIGPSELASTAVTPGAYGTAGSVATFTTDADGRLTAAATVPIVLGLSNLSDVFYPTPPVQGDTLIYDASRPGFIPLAGSSTGGSVPGIISSAEGVNSIHHKSITLTNICGLLGSISYVNIEQPASSGVTCTLPDPALLDTPSMYSIEVNDANPVTLAPSGTNLLNGFNAPLPPIKGPNALYIVERRSDNTWRARAYYQVGYGEPMTSICSAVGGSTNTSSSGSGAYIDFSLTCTIPATAERPLTAGTVFEGCSIFKLVTSGSPPDLFWDVLINATPLLGNLSVIDLDPNITSRITTQCFSMVVGTVSAGSAPFYAGPKTGWGNVESPFSGSDATTPTISVTSNILITWRANFTTAGTPTTSLQQLATYGRLSVP